MAVTQQVPVGRVRQAEFRVEPAPQLRQESRGPLVDRKVRRPEPQAEPPKGADWAAGTAIAVPT